MQFWDELRAPIKRIKCLQKYQVDPQAFRFEIETTDGATFETCGSSGALLDGGIYYNDTDAGIVFLRDDIVAASIIFALDTGADIAGQDIDIMDAKQARMILASHQVTPPELKAENRL